MGDSLWFKNGRLTSTAQEIFDRSRRFLTTNVQELDTRTLDQRFEEHCLQVLLDGEPIMGKQSRHLVEEGNVYGT